MSNYIWLEHHVAGTDKVGYAYKEMPENSFATALGMFYILFRLLIPFEVILILEFVKFRYSNLIEQDSHFYNVENGKSIKVQNMSMHEEMAQVKYLFCDKTGTLTKNQLTFREMKIGRGAKKSTLAFGSNRIEESGTIGKSAHEPKKEDMDEEAAFPSSIQWKFKKLQASAQLDEMIRCILLCHDASRIEEKVDVPLAPEEDIVPFAQVQKKKKKEEIVKPETVQSLFHITGNNQDELVLMRMIEEHYDSEFLGRTGNKISIRIRDFKEEYQIVNFYEFTSDRKMMSMTLIRLSDNQVVNYCKGADDKIKNLLDDKGFSETNVIDEVDMYAARGLRTLMFAKRELDNSHLMPGIT